MRRIRTRHACCGSPPTRAPRKREFGRTRSEHCSPLQVDARRDGLEQVVEKYRETDRKIPARMGDLEREGYPWTPAIRRATVQDDAGWADRSAVSKSIYFITNPISVLPLSRSYIFLPAFHRARDTTTDDGHRDGTKLAALAFQTLRIQT